MATIIQPTPQAIRHFGQRTYQKAPLIAKQQGCRFFVEALHRRAGKDRNWVAITMLSMMERVGVYFHIFPSLNQGRRDLWDNIVHQEVDGVKESVKARDMFPAHLVKNINETEMQIETTNGSLWQIMGADSEDAVKRTRGPNPVGVVASEHAFMRADLWDTLSPVLAENGGWIAFVSTPHMENDQFHTLYKFAQANPWNPETKKGWFSQLKTVEDTRRDAEGENGEPVISLEMIDEFRRSGMREEKIQQEYYCSFRGGMHGTIYGDLMLAADNEKRIGSFPYMNTLPVGVIFDLGNSQSDLIAMWFYQIYQNKIHFIDYEEAPQKGLDYWNHLLKEKKQYVYGRMVLPWDGWAAEAYFSAVGWRNIRVCDRTPSVQGSIDKVRLEFGKFHFDKQKCHLGIEHLEKYKRKFDEEKRIFIGTPVHDIHSHGSDALRNGIEGDLEPLYFQQDFARTVKVISDFDPFASNNFNPTGF